MFNELCTSVKEFEQNHPHYREAIQCIFVRNRELRNSSLIQAKKHLTSLQEEISYLIMATPTGPRRDKFTEINIHISAAWLLLSELHSEERPE